MKFTPRTSPNETITNQILEIALIFVFSFVSSYAIVLIGPFFLKSAGQLILELEIEHFPSFVVAYFLFSIFTTLNFYRRRLKKIIITSIEFNDERSIISIWRKHYYKNAIEQSDIPYSDLAYEVIYWDEYAKIEMKKGGIFLGAVSSKDVIWEDEPLLMKQIIHKLKEIKPMLPPNVEARNLNVPIRLGIILLIVVIALILMLDMK